MVVVVRRSHPRARGCSVMFPTRHVSSRVGLLVPLRQPAAVSADLGVGRSGNLVRDTFQDREGEANGDGAQG